MTILFPIGGIGKRFRKAKYTTPKHLLLVDSITLLEKALSTYAKEDPKVFILRKEYACGQTAQIIDKAGGLPYILSYSTQGPLETCLAIEDTNIINHEDEVLVADCDAWMDAKEMGEALTHFHMTGAEGGVTIQKSTSPDVSYASIKNGRILKTDSHRRLSEWSTTGPYWWKQWSTFLTCARLAVDKGCFTLSPCYNKLIRKRGLVSYYPVRTFVHLGDPQAYAQYCRTHIRA